MRRFEDTPESKAAYLACLQSGAGYVANCCSGWPQGYKLHSASCTWLHANQNHNPIMRSRGTGKIWAATLQELEENIRKNQPGRRADRCSTCLPMRPPPEEYDTDMPRESHLVVPGGQVESNRSRH